MSEVDFKSVTSAPAGDFEPEQKRYLEGFVAGLQIAKAAKSVSGTNTAPATDDANRGVLLLSIWAKQIMSVCIPKNR